PSSLVLSSLFFLLLLALPPSPALYPYTTLFRSELLLPARELLELRDRLVDLTFGRIERDRRLGLVLVLLEIHLELEQLGQVAARSEEHTSELQSRENLVCRLLLEKKKSKATMLN